MKVGILSDTHNDVDKILKAINFLNLQHVEIVLHAGDFSTPQSAKYFSKLKCPFVSVFGNNDFCEYELSKTIEPFGIISLAPYKFALDGKTFLLTHYLNNNYENIDYVIYGHTHVARTQKVGKSILINPGECCGRRYGKSTVAILDTLSNTTKIYTI